MVDNDKPHAKLAAALTVLVILTFLGVILGVMIPLIIKLWSWAL